MRPSGIWMASNFCCCAARELTSFGGKPWGAFHVVGWLGQYVVAAPALELVVARLDQTRGFRDTLNHQLYELIASFEWRRVLVAPPEGDEKMTERAAPVHPRIAPRPEIDWDEDTAALLSAVAPLNVFTTMANHPKLFKRWMVFGAHVLMKSTLPPRERELLILRVGWRCDSEYEFGQHTIIGRREGLSDEEIGRVARSELGGWSERDAALVAAADELVAEQRISDPTWAKLAEEWSTQQLMDIVFAVGQYVMTCMALRTFGVVLDEGVPGFPPGAERGRG